MSSIEKSKFESRDSIKSAMLHTSLMSFFFQVKRMAAVAATIPNLSEDVTIEELGDSEELKQV